jgi:hypothetical protein
MMDAEFGWSREDSWTWLRDLVPDEELGGGSILVWKDISKAQSRSAATQPERAASGQ